MSQDKDAVQIQKENQAFSEMAWVDQEVSRRSKDTLIAVLLWLFLGAIGGHRFYLGRTNSAITMLVLTVVGWATTWLLVGFIPLFIVGVWVFVDIFLISGIVADENRKVKIEVEQELNNRRNAVR